LVKNVEAAPDISGSLLAVADGHGGDTTSSYVAQQLSDGLFDRMLLSSSGSDKNGVEEALRMTFQFLNDSTLQLSKQTRAHYETGTTLSVVYVSGRLDKAHIAVIGDSPVILARKNGNAIKISPEHNARSNEEERKAAEKRGGIYEDGYMHSRSKGGMGLQMTRDIGCHSMGDVLLRYPDIYELSIQDGDVLILASDGLLDPAHVEGQEEVKRIARLVLEEGAEADDLVNDALKRLTGDNVSAIVYRHQSEVK
jgi:serine/threonine protein phosphatase PrpC